MVKFWIVKLTPASTEKTPTLFPPLVVIRLPPSMVVSALMVFVLVTVIVAAPPQLKVTVPSKLPPPGRQAFSAASEQLAPAPVPTTHARAREGRVRHCRSRAIPKPLHRNALFLMSPDALSCRLGL